ncbi:MAG: polysaccharide deacetylase family protein [Luteolibacter sp.]
MDHSLEQIGSSLANTPSLGKITRRGFIAASAATMASCKAASSTPSAGPTAAVKTPSNKEYRTPSVNGPVQRNNAGNPSSNFSKNAGVTFSRVPVSGNYIAITFDDGPHPQNTPRLLDMLAQRNIKATFYVIGRSVDLHPGVLRRTVAEGHEIGNHSHTHRLLSKLGDSEVRQEMQRCQDAIGRAAGVRPRTMRPPYGGLLQRQRELIHDEFGYPTILWSVDPLDWKRPGPSVVASRILSGTNAGGIVLAHDLHSQTVDAMPATLDGLLRKGFKFVTVSQLIAMKVDAVDSQASVKPTS